MDDALAAELHHSQVIDMTTTGGRTGVPRRIEIYLHDLDGRLFISGTPYPTKRAWLRNIEADPHITIHLKQHQPVDVPATARVIEDPDERRPLIEAAARRWKRDDIDDMMAMSPLIEIVPDDV
jgi:deazaflavin-dependent oxidoreductase (nitroreductase family)